MDHKGEMYYLWSSFYKKNSPPWETNLERWLGNNRKITET